MLFIIRMKLDVKVLITDFDQRIAERLYHLPETLKIMFVKIEGEKQVILNEFKSYVEKNF